MKHTKLVRLLGCFSKRELSQFVEFVESPFYNKNENLVSLVKFLEKYAPTFDHQKCSFEQAHHSFFGKKKFQKDAITKLLSKLFLLAESFIATIQLNENAVLRNLQLLKFHNQRSNTTFFESLHIKTQKSHAEVQQKDDDWAFHQMEMEHEQAFFLSANADDGTGDINLQSTNDALDFFYILRKLKYLCYMKNRQRLVSFPFVYSMEKEVLHFIENRQDGHSSLLTVWSSAFRLLSNPNDRLYYENLKSNIDQFDLLLPNSEKRVLYTYLENTAKYVCDNYYEELFELYEKQINEKILYKQKFLVPVVVKNIVTVAIRLKKHDWADRFLKTQKDHVFPDHIDKEDVFSLCQTMLSFAKGNFEEALVIIGQTNISNLYFKLEERRLRLKIYYELGYFDLFEDSVNSFRKFLTCNKNHIADYFLQANRNFINAISTLYKSSSKYKDRSSKLDALLNESIVLPEKDWLVQKSQKVVTKLS